jgi:hypothetical protein
LMGVYEEDSGFLLNWFEARIEEPLPPLVKLGYKRHVWVAARSFRSTEIKTVIVSHLCRKNNVCNHYSSWTGNTLNTVNQHSSAFILSALNKVNSVVKNASDVFVHVVFQMIAFVFNSLFLVIVFAVVCRTVYDMSNSLLA